MDFVNRLAGEFKLRPQQVQAAVELLDAGNTIPLPGTGKRPPDPWTTRCCGSWRNGWNT